MTATFRPQMANKIEHWPVDRLVPYARNARTHSADQVNKIAASITEFGFNAPILVDEESGEIVAGHGRLMAAQRLGMDEVPVVPVGHMTPDQRRAYVLADNRLTDLGGWDDDMLAAELADLDGMGFDLSAAGFDDVDLDDLLGANDDNPDPDPDPDPESGQAPVDQERERSAEQCPHCGQDV